MNTITQQELKVKDAEIDFLKRMLSYAFFEGAGNTTHAADEAWQDSNSVTFLRTGKFPADNPRFKYVNVAYKEFQQEKELLAELQKGNNT